MAPVYGPEKRRLRVIKYRGTQIPRRFPRSRHSHRRHKRISSARRRRASDDNSIARGSRRAYPNSMNCLAGASSEGSSTLILGPAGTGKSLISVMFAIAAVARGEKAGMFIFDERTRVCLFDRMRGLGIDLESLQQSGNIVHKTDRRGGVVSRRICTSRACDRA